MTQKLPTILLQLFAALISLAVLGRILFDTGAPYAPDPSAFFAFTSRLANALVGTLPWHDVVHSTSERTLTMMTPAALLAAITGFRSPEFYMTVAWFLYVLPLPFLYLSLVRSFRSPEPLDYAVGALFLATIPIVNLGVLYFTDVPSLTMAIAGLSFLAHAMRSASVWRLSLGFFLLAMAVTVRLPNAVPFFVAMLLLGWLKWPAPLMSWKAIVKAIGFAAAATLLIGVVLRFDIPIAYAFKLNASWDQTIWKYGNGNIEFGVENLFAFRFWKHFLPAAVYTFLPFIALTIAALGSGRASTFHHASAWRPWHAAAALLAVVLYCVFAATTMFVNAHYVLPALALLLPVLAATHFQKAAAQGILIACVLISLDALVYQAFSVRTPFAGRILDDRYASLAAPIAVVAKRDIQSPVPALTQVLLASGAANRSIAVEFLNLNSMFLSENALRFYLMYEADTGVLMRQAYENVRIRGRHLIELQIREIYRRYAAGNALAYTNADFVITAQGEIRSPGFTKMWAEFELQQAVRDSAKRADEASIGLAPVASFVGSFKDRRQTTQFVLYRIEDRATWSRLVRQHFCRYEGIEDALFRIWCDGAPASPTKVIPINGATMASSAALIESERGPILKLELKEPPQTGFSRVFVHFVPKKDTPNTCPFFVADHDVFDKSSRLDYTLLPTQRVGALKSCRYEVKVGVRLDATGDNVFDEREFQNRTALEPK